ncbi:type II toxin-antitoxin system VapC family toxin [Leucobacter soli]|uniref:Ribonuclease VapC n=1 Tax=Leucobacter soli TaxID=2812850 RepID=A0A916JZI8_9MICO|nr:type II toxin-antitoxin system VapC family toxin [Leucobacter soli]CAG7618700.1 Ribonuclease VapC5 [Leucobacter soli]
MTAEHDGILDTSVVIALEHQDPSTLPLFPAITAVTLAELSAGPLAATDETTRANRQVRLQAVEASFDPIPLDADAARAFGRVAASLRATGRKRSARAYDALIAATAISRGLPVYTLNPDDFAGIDGLDVRTPRRPRREPED